ncbi:RNA polymerase sigma-70 factor [Prolixibacteraceae bacterium JC049]|nr:RNA polymerase sigma-70 factor [Prolixibacteraceae bacterium JC049]
MISVSDIEVVRSLRNSEEHMFDMLFNNYFPRLVFFAREYVNDEEMAKNLVQDSFTTLWSKRKELEESININAWLYTTVKFHCLNYLRSKKVVSDFNKEETIAKQHIHLNYYSLSELDTTAMAFTEIEQIVEATLVQLPEQCQRVFRMSRFEDKKNREIAEELGIVVKTVEAHMSKALKSMRVALRDYLPMVFPFI